MCSVNKRFKSCLLLTAISKDISPVSIKLFFDAEYSNFENKKGVMDQKIPVFIECVSGNFLFFR